MKHAILGAGAVGGLVGTGLAALGEEVIVAVRPERLAEYPKNLTLERPAGVVTAPAKAVAALTEPADVLWIATKTYQLESALAAVQASPELVVPLLNGVDHIAVLRSRFGHDRVVPATIAVEAECPAPGRFVQRSPIVRLNLAGSGEPRLGPIIARLGEFGFTCQFMQNEKTLLWSKLCFLAPFALVTTASGKNKGEIVGDSRWKDKLFSAVAETCAVAKAEGAEVDTVKLRALFDSFPPGTVSSMAKHLAAHQRLELDGIAGPIVRGGERYGIEVPTTKELMEAIRTKEQQSNPA